MWTSIGQHRKTGWIDDITTVGDYVLNRHIDVAFTVVEQDPRDMLSISSYFDKLDFFRQNHLDCCTLVEDADI